MNLLTDDSFESAYYQADIYDVDQFSALPLYFGTDLYKPIDINYNYNIEECLQKQQLD